jgi:uncharacterized membrane protein YwzB
MAWWKRQAIFYLKQSKNEHKNRLQECLLLPYVTIIFRFVTHLLLTVLKYV